MPLAYFRSRRHERVVFEKSRLARGPFGKHALQPAGWPHVIEDEIRGVAGDMDVPWFSEDRPGTREGGDREPIPSGQNLGVDERRRACKSRRQQP